MARAYLHPFAIIRSGAMTWASVSSGTYVTPAGSSASAKWGLGVNAAIARWAPSAAASARTYVRMRAQNCGNP